MDYYDNLFSGPFAPDSMKSWKIAPVPVLRMLAGEWLTDQACRTLQMLNYGGKKFAYLSFCMRHAVARAHNAFLQEPCAHTLCECLHVAGNQPRLGGAPLTGPPPAPDAKGPAGQPAAGPPRHAGPPGQLPPGMRAPPGPPGQQGAPLQRPSVSAGGPPMARRAAPPPPGAAR